MTTIKIDFENRDHLREWLRTLEKHLKDINLTNAPSEPNSIFWASDSSYHVYKSFTRDYIFNRFHPYISGLTLIVKDETPQSKLVLGVGSKISLETNLDPDSGFLQIMSRLKPIPFEEKKFTCGTLVKDAMPSPLRFVIANMPTYIGAMIEGKLLPREDEINDRLWKSFFRNQPISTKEDMLSYFSTYGILAYVLNHVRWADLGLKELLKPIYDHWRGLGTSSSPQPIPISNQYVPTSGTITIPNPNVRGGISRWVSALELQTSGGIELDPQLMFCSNYPTDFDPLP